MSLTIRVSGGDIFQENPELKAYSEFRDLSHEEMSFIARVYDHNSLLKKLPLDSRKDKALQELGLWKDGAPTKEGELLKKPKQRSDVKKAIDFFSKLQGYNPYDLVEAQEALLKDAAEVMKTGVIDEGSELEDRVDIVDRMKVGKEVANILKARQEIIDLIDPPDPDQEKQEEKSKDDSLVDQIGQSRRDAQG